MGIVITPPGPATISGTGAGSVSIHGAATGPGAGAAIATIPFGSLVQGTRYQIDCYVFIDATSAQATDDDNMALSFNGAVVATIAVQGTNANLQQPTKFTFFSKPQDASHGITVQAVAAATATAVYHATIAATPIGT